MKKWMTALAMAPLGLWGQTPPLAECPANTPVSSWSECRGVLADASSGLRYAGEFLNGRFHGQGEFTMADGRQYVGAFREGAMVGRGRLLDAQGREVFAGEFVNGRPQTAPPVTPAMPPAAAAPVAAPPAAPPPPVATAQSSTNEIGDGVFLRTQMFGSSLFTEVFQIRGNRIASGPKKFLRADEFTPENASKIGTIRTEGDQAFTRWSTDDKEYASWFKKDSSCPNFGGGIVCRVEPFRPGERVTGTFSGTIGSSALSQSIRLQLNEDGTYSLKRTGVVNAPSTGAISEGIETGRYTLENSSLRLQPDNGPAVEHLVFPYPAKDPMWLWFGDRMLDGKVVRNAVR